jgi:hydrogenase maturation protease
LNAGEVLIIGIGNDFAGDDAAGLETIRELEPAFRTASSPGLAPDLLRLMEGEGHVIMIDAARSGAPPGTLYHFNAAQGALPAHFNRLSSHGMGVSEAIELARTLGQLPPVCEVWGIEGRQFHQGADMSPAVRQAVENLAVQLRQPATDALHGGRVI